MMHSEKIQVGQVTRDSFHGNNYIVFPTNIYVVILNNMCDSLYYTIQLRAKCRPSLDLLIKFYEDTLSNYKENSNESIQPPWVYLNYETFG